MLDTYIDSSIKYQASKTHLVTPSTPHLRPIKCCIITSSALKGAHMSVAISVGPPAITINQGNTFMVTNLRGEIDPYEEHGVFARDTRFISAYRFTINQSAW